ncbi:erythromycin esterase-like protein [Neolewinella xylanilytica]|uniref:Erythromycin esterase-like protein n=1 Tax=Neolewinella xylanilytica TaxID=1514080 RepID=A0A2S6I9N2_9BACT|nr:erythromycin esterase family protein [Neolewinella xylanilytica]PPK88169.1 erythromycin esterase-like protein [Neolewinella xylanilytica]
MRFLILLTLSWFVCLPRAGAQCPDGLEKYLTGFSGLEAGAFSFLDDQLDSVSVLGYGEDTHGSAEFTLLAGELLKYLVEQHRFTGIVLETMVGEGAYLDAYVQGERDDRDYLLNEINSSWRYRTEEFVALLEWMRAYNVGHPDRPIHLYGSEMQFVQSDARLVADYLSALGHEVEVAAYDKHLWQRFSPEEKAALFNNYRQLLDYVTVHGPELVTASSRDAYEDMLRHVEVIGQFVLVINQPRERHKHDLRDLYAAENLLLLLRDGSRDVRLLYWAHNAHVGDWVSNGQVDVTGHQLAKRMGRGYYGLATDFGNGEFVALAPRGEVWADQVISFELDPTTFTSCLARTGKPYSFLDLRAARKDPALKASLSGPLKVMAGAGAQYYGQPTIEENMGSAFDGILYLDRVQPINRLPRE